MTVVAARFGITDVALRKKCIRHSVPVPGRGYWQQRDAGKSSPPTVLPGDSGTGGIEFCLRREASVLHLSHKVEFVIPLQPEAGVRTRADHRAEAWQRMEAKKQRLVTIEQEEREARARAVEECKALDKLHADALAWESAQRLRAYIAAVAASPEPEGEGADRAIWIDWATRQADAIDPLTSRGWQ